MRRHRSAPPPIMRAIVRRASFCALLGGLLVGPSLWADTSKPQIAPIPIPNLPLGVVILPSGKALNLTVGIGSSAFRSQADAPGRIWLMTDRGPTIECADPRRVITSEADQLCGGDRNGRYFPLPGFAPSIYGVDIGIDLVARINVFIPLKGKSGRPISGRPPPLPALRNETAFAADGKTLPPDASGVDPEAFVRLADGTFWIAEEYGPSLLQVSPDGVVLRRLVPRNLAASFKDADYEVSATLPAIIGLRAPARGFGGLALSPDERFLFVMTKGALANPDVESARRSRFVRIFKIARDSGEAVAEYLYEMDDPGRFGADIEGRERPQNHVQASELVAIAEDRLIVLERIEKSARLHALTLSDSSLVPPVFDLPETLPSLEQSDRDRFAALGIVPLEKTLVIATDQIAGLPARLEGVAVLGPNELLVINDNEFGVDGGRSQLFRITLPEAVLR